MSYTSLVTARGAISGRPDHYRGLLLHPIGADEKGLSYTGWENDHSAMQRFYVGGLLWFMQASGIEDLGRLAAYATKGVDLVRDNTDWHSMPFSGDRWNHCSINQFRAAKNRKPQYFQKAALVIAACEAAVIDAQATQRRLRTDISVADVYSKMSVIPAVCSIDDFDKDFLKELSRLHPGAADDIRDGSSQSSKTFLDQMAVGYSVTLETANEVKKIVENKFKVRCGNVRSRPGTQGGTRQATPYEFFDPG